MLSWSTTLALLMLSTSGATGSDTPEPRVGGKWLPCGRTAALRGDLSPGLAGSHPRELVDGLRGRMFFTADDGEHGRELWASTGPGGVGTHLVKDILPGAGSSGARELVQMGGTTYFVANDGEHGAELWKSDGTDVGTVLVKDVWPGQAGAAPQELLVVNGVLYFTADDGVNGRELWRSDGTEAGTALLHELVPGPGDAGIHQLTSWSRQLVFVSNDTQGRPTLWKSTGLINGLTPLFSSTGETAFSTLTPVNNRLFYLHHLGRGATDLYVTDTKTWRSTALRRFTGTPPHDLTAMGGGLYFGAGAGGFDTDSLGDELWKSDGTAQGTVLVADIALGPAGSSPASLVVAGERLYFSADDQARGRELWTSDGTAVGTTLVVDLRPGAEGGEPRGLVALQNHLFFSARVSGLGHQAWTSDGTAENTWPLDAVAIHLQDAEPRLFARSSWDVFFIANDGVHGHELWSLPFRPQDSCAPAPAP